MNLIGRRLQACTHCPQADLSKTRAPCLADEKLRYIGDMAAAGACPLDRFPLEGAEKIAHGAAGIAKAVTGIGRASHSLIARRTAICSACDRAELSMGVIQKCRECGCLTWAKIRNAAERCPLGKWERSGKSIAVIQPSRFGDIASLLPAMRRLALEGHAVKHVVHRDFLSLVQGLSYVEPVVFDGGHREVAAATAVGASVAQETIATQARGNPNRQTIKPDNFLIAPWIHAGMAELFDKLPLILDNRDAVRERDLCRNLIGEDSRPLLLVSTEGYSSQYQRGPALVKWARDRWGETCNVIDLSGVRAERFQDLCGLFERASALISIDTGTLHLSYATRTPTVGLVNDEAYAASPRRPHWIERLTYSESLTDAGKQRIATAIDAEVAKPRGPHILHVVDDSWRPQTDSDDYRRLAIAAETWAGLPGWTTCRFRSPGRTSRDLGDARAMPFIKDMFDWACSLALPGDVVVFSNADIGLVPEAPDVIRRALDRWPCAYGHRVDTDESRAFSAAELSTRKQYGGADLFAFQPEWWRKVRDELPDLLEGYTNWDTCATILFQRHHPGCVLPAIAWHKSHHSYWQSHFHCPGQEHNAKLSREWAENLPGGCELLTATPQKDRTFWPVQVERSEIRVADVENAVFAPFYGEFGVMMMFWVPLVYHYPARRRIVCCRRGEEAYFPGCEFDYDWPDRVPDRDKLGTMHNRPFAEKARVAARYPGAIWVDVQPWHAVQPCRVSMAPRHVRGLPKVDIAVGARWRQAFPEKNWPRWGEVLGDLKSRGYTLAALGKRDTSFDWPGFDLRAWECGDDADANLEILQTCRLYLGTDTGLTHLAAHAGTQMLIFRHGTPDLTCWHPMRDIAGNRLTFVADGWEKPGAAKEAAQARLKARGIPAGS